jgi:flagellar assembly protein FliH
VLVNPADLETLQAAIGDLQAQVAGIELCDLQADQRVERGGAIVRTTEGEVDAGVQTQLERAREVLSAALAGDGPASETGESPA